MPFGEKTETGRLLGGLPALLAVAVTALVLVVPSRVQAVVVPPGFQARVLPIPRASEATSPGYINGLRKPTTLAFAPDGKMFVGDWFGRVKVFDSVEDFTPTLAVDVSTEVHSYGDRGLLGMKLDPEFGTSGHNYIYLSYAYDVPLGSVNPPHAEFSDGGDNCKNESPYTDCLISGRVVRIALDPTTGVAAAGAVEPPQQQLVNSWCQQFNSHSMGDIEFDSSGALLVSGGEGANYSEADYGQFSNPCGDPENEGGSLRAQDVRTASPSDPTDYSGSIIRIDRETGEPLPDNPLFGSADERAGRILGYGLRNPFRFEIRPGTSDVYIGDVGQNKWEELDRLTSPPAPGQHALDFGWPCYEGSNGVNTVLASWQALAGDGHAPPCQELYASPSLVTAPFWAYGHGASAGHLFEGDQCDPSPGAAFSGLAFYQVTGVPAEDLFPEEDRGALFMADAARGCIWVMRLGPGGEPDPSQISNFATSDSESRISPVDIVQGPEGALYAPNFYNDSIEQIRYFPGNRAPTAAIAASKIDGPIGGGFTVDFNAGGSSDPDVEEEPGTDALHYEWDLNGDGEFNDGADQPTAQETYSTPENVTVKVRVSDEFNHSDVASVTLYPGDEGPPVPEILEPTEGLDWAIGDSIHYAGTASDPGGETVGAGQLHLHWDFTLQHCPEACHAHPLSSSDTPSGDLVAPPHEYPSHLRFELTATDARDRSATASVEVFPRLIQVGLSSDPSGIPVTLDGRPASEAPFTLIAGNSVAVSAPEAVVVGGVPYAFSSWSDGGARAHEATVYESLNLIAHYKPAGSQGPPVVIPPTISLPPPPVTTPQTARLILASRPAGVRLRVGRSTKLAPFAFRFPLGTKIVILAPPRIFRGARLLWFQEWKMGGQGFAARRQSTVLNRDLRYVAMYRAK